MSLKGQKNDPPHTLAADTARRAAVGCYMGDFGMSDIVTRLRDWARLMDPRESTDVVVLHVAKNRLPVEESDYWKAADLIEEMAGALAVLQEAAITREGGGVPIPRSVYVQVTDIFAKIKDTNT